MSAHDVAVQPISQAHEHTIPLPALHHRRVDGGGPRSPDIRRCP